jgi:hypothetical protein
MQVPLDRQRFPLSMVLAAFILACGSSPTQVPNEYTVIGTLLSVRGETAQVCAVETYSLPPTCGGGVTIYGVEVRTAPGARVFSNGTVDTGLVRVVGTWDGQALTLVGALRPAGANEMPPWPACAAGAKNSFLPDSTAQRINDDTPSLRSRGIEVLSITPCNDGILVVVPVADSKTVSYLTDAYGQLQVVGWLQPAHA